MDRCEIEGDPLRVAEEITQRFLRLADGDPHDPATWLEAADQRGVIVYCFQGDNSSCDGEIIARPGRAGVIALNTSRPAQDQAAILVHELAHNELNEWFPAPMGFLSIYRYNDDPRDLRHQIARMVERMILG